MSSVSSLNDSQILRETKLSAPDTKGRVQLAFTLPSGRLVTSSDRLVPSEIKGKVLIAWAEAIRAEDAYDIQAREERERLARVEKRARELSSDAVTADHVRAENSTSNGSTSGLADASAGTLPGSSSSVLPDEPGALIESKLLALRTEHAKVVAQRDAILLRLASVEASIDQWSTVLRALRPSTTSTASPSAQPETSDEVTTTGAHSVGDDLDRIDRRIDADRRDRADRNPRAQRRRRVARNIQPQLGSAEGEAVQQSAGTVAGFSGDRSDNLVAEGGAGSDSRSQEDQNSGDREETF